MGISSFPLEWTSQYAWLILQWTSINFSKYIKNELHPSLNPRNPYTYTEKSSDAHVRRQDNGHEAQSSICIHKIHFCLSVITRNCLQHSLYLLKVRYCIEFKNSLMLSREREKKIKHFLNWAQISKVNFLRKLQWLDKAIPCKLVLPAWITAKFMQLALSFRKRLWSVVINWHT